MPKVRSTTAITFVIAVALVGAGAPGNAQDDTSGRIGPRAERALKSMSEYLQGAGEFSFRAAVTYDSVLADELKVQYGGVADVTVRRPDRLRVEYTGDELPRRIVIDGQRFTILDRAANLYATAEVPADLDAAMDEVFESYGYSVPIADFVYSDPFAVLVGSVETGNLVGRHAIDGRPCHHLVFQQETIDWQIWIEDGPAPLPRKLVITYKQEPGAPQYSAVLTDWNLGARAADSYFEFEPPPGARSIDFLPAFEEEGGQ